jgi:hypothetical protein
VQALCSTCTILGKSISLACSGTYSNTARQPERTEMRAAFAVVDAIVSHAHMSFHPSLLLTLSPSLKPNLLSNRGLPPFSHTPLATMDAEKDLEAEKDAPNNPETLRDTSSANEKTITPSDSKPSLPVPYTDDEGTVDWGGPDDPHNPRDWTSKAKVFNCLTIILLTLLTPLASSMFAPGVPDVLRNFHTDSQTLAEFVVSIYILGYAIGPLLIGPASETYGRYPVYVACSVLFLIFTIACAVAQSMAQLIVFRFFAASFGVCPITLGGASIVDLIVQEKRGAAMRLYAMGPLMGPVIGPVAGSYLASAEGWRWT